MKTIAFIAIFALLVSAGTFQVLGDMLSLQQNTVINIVSGPSAADRSFARQNPEQRDLSWEQRHLLGSNAVVTAVFQPLSHSFFPKLKGIYKINRCVQEPR